MTWECVADLDMDINRNFETNLSDYFLGAKVHSSGQDLLHSIDPGTATIYLNNEDGRFSPYREVIGNRSESVAFAWSPSGSNHKFACKYTMIHDTCLSTVKAWMRAYSGTSKCVACLYSDSGGAPDVLLIVSREVTIGDTTQWWEFEFENPYSVTEGTVYWLTILAESRVVFYSGVGTTNQAAYVADTYSDGPSNPFGTPTNWQSYALQIRGIMPLDDFGRVIIRDGSNHLFGGHIIDIRPELGAGEKRVVLEAADLIGLMGKKITLGLMTGKKAGLILHRTLDLLERGEIISNPSASIDLTNWSKIVGTETMTRDTVAPLEGPACVKCVTPGSVTAEGVQYDIYADDVVSPEVLRGGLFVNAPVGATMRVIAYTSSYQPLSITNFTGTGDWQHLRPVLMPPGASFTAALIRIETRTTAQAITFYVSSLHCVLVEMGVFERDLEEGESTLYNVSFLDTPGLEVVQKVVDSEPGYAWVQPDQYGGTFTFRDRSYAPSSSLTIDEVTGGSYTPYQSLNSRRPAKNRISKVIINCATDKSQAADPAVVWIRNAPILVGSAGSDSGTAEVVLSDFLWDMDKSWTINMWIGGVVTVNEGGHLHTSEIQANDTDSLTLKRWVPHQPTAATAVPYSILENTYRDIAANFAAPCREPTIVALPAQAGCTATWLYFNDVGGMIRLINSGASPWTVTSIVVSGIPTNVANLPDESQYVYAPPGGSQFADQDLNLSMPFSLETSQAVIEAAATQGNKRVNPLLLMEAVVIPQSSSVLTNLLGLSPYDRITVRNKTSNHSLGVEKVFSLLGADWAVSNKFLSMVSLRVEED